MNSLKELRELNGFTKVDISKFLGITPQAVGKIEKSNGISFRNAIILSKLYKKTIEEIYVASQ